MKDILIYLSIAPAIETVHIADVELIVKKFVVTRYLQVSLFLRTFTETKKTEIK